MVGLRAVAVAVAVVLAVAGGFVAYDELRHVGAPDRTTVTLLDEDGAALGTVEVRVADTFRERYTGLSNTDELGPDEGILFVHEEEGEYAYVMRDMAFPIDIVFVAENRTVTAVHHAETESRPYTRYSGVAKWVLEVPHGWTIRHGVGVGDRVRIEGPVGEATAAG